MTVTVAIPVLNGGPVFGEVLAAVRAQDLDREIELLVADSGSTDGSVELARAHGAEVLLVERFSHGGTRNLLASRASGEHIAFLTQDAMPADRSWLRRLVSAFDAADDIGLAFGPYRARQGASRAVRRELDSWFGSFAPDGDVRIDRLDEAARPAEPGRLLGPKAFFTDANGCVARAALQRVPFRDVPYAEDHQLALDMLRAGYAKVYVPDAAVVHSHEYTTLENLRRAFDEWRGLHDIYGYVEPLSARRLRALAADVRADGSRSASHHVS